MTVSRPVLLMMAAGLSKRFGSDNKLHATLKGKPLYAHCIQNFSPVSFVRRVVVLPPDDTILHRAFSQSGYETIYNHTPEKGLGSSIWIGLQHISQSSNGPVCIALADMPFVTPSHLTQLLKTPNTVCVSTHNGVSMPPVVLPHDDIKKLISLPQGDIDANRKTLINSPNRQCFALTKNTATDIDTVSDLNALHHL